MLVDSFHWANGYITDKKIANFIISQAIHIWDVSPEALYKSEKKYKSTDPRMSCYILIYTYTRFNQTHIGTEFSKDRTLICKSIKRYNDIKKSPAGWEAFFEKHKELEDKVIKFIKTID